MQTLLSVCHYHFSLFMFFSTLRHFSFSCALYQVAKLLILKEFFKFLAIQLQHYAFRCQCFGCMRTITFEQDVLLSKVASLRNSLSNEWYSLLVLVLDEQLKPHFTLDHKENRLRYISLLVYHFFKIVMFHFETMNQI